MTHLEQGPENQRPPEPLPETVFVRRLAEVILEDQAAPPNPLTSYEPGQPIIVEPEDEPAFMEYLRARVATARRVRELAQDLPEDVRSGGRVLLDILAGLTTQAVNIAKGDFEAADPIPCPDNTELEDFAAALLIVARHTNADVTGAYWGTAVIASPSMTVTDVTDDFFNDLHEN